MEGLTPTAIQNQFDLLFSNLNGIKGALISKGCDIEEGDSLADYTEKIEEMSIGGGMEKITFADGYYLLDENTNWCKLVIDTTFGTMAYVETKSVAAVTGNAYVSGNNAFTVYVYKRELNLPVTFKSDNMLTSPTVSGNSMVLDSAYGGKLYLMSMGDKFYYKCAGLSTATFQYSSTFALSANIGSIQITASNQVTLYQYFANTNTYTPTARIFAVLEGEIEPLS